jgi:hypothetical protein
MAAMKVAKSSRPSASVRRMVKMAAMKVAKSSRPAMAVAKSRPSASVKVAAMKVAKSSKRVRGDRSDEILREAKGRRTNRSLLSTLQGEVVRVVQVAADLRDEETQLKNKNSELQDRISAQAAEIADLQDELRLCHHALEAKPEAVLAPPSAAQQPVPIQDVSSVQRRSVAMHSQHTPHQKVGLPPIPRTWTAEGKSTESSVAAEALRSVANDLNVASRFLLDAGDAYDVGHVGDVVHAAHARVPVRRRQRTKVPGAS